MKQRRIYLPTIEDAKEFVAAATKCDFDIDILYDHIYVDAKSFLGVIGLGFKKDLTVKYFGENDKFETMLKNYAVA